MADETAYLSTRGLTCGYRGVPVLSDVALSVARGEVVAVLGPNGAGKTTMVRTIMGVQAALGGHIEVCGQDVTGWRSSKRFDAGVVWVPEGRRLFPDLSVLDNLRVASPDDERLARVRDLLPVVERAANQLAGSLSGGEQQMVALARALIASPKVLLLDEPSLGLAPMVVTEIMAAISRLRDADCAVLLVEQNIEMALRLADRAIALEDGHSHDLGPTSGLMDDQRLRDRYVGIR